MPALNDSQEAKLKGDTAVCHTMGLKLNESAIEPCSTQLGFEE